jgi:CheY-like chemotaxis protein
MQMLTVLVMEDDAIIAMLLNEVLVAMGHQVCATAATESEAIRAATIHHPDLMIVDEQLRFGSGLAAVETIIKRTPIPYLFVTGDSAKVRAQLPDAVIIQKPYSQGQLARAMEKAANSCTPWPSP